MFLPHRTPSAQDNRLLGTFELSGFPAMPRGEAQIDVTFDVDANGILEVSAVETTSGREATIRIENVERLDPQEIDRMVREAQTFKEADGRALERVEAKAKLEMYAKRSRDLLRDKELRGKMDEAETEEVRAAVEDADAWADTSADGASAAQIQQKLAALATAVRHVFDRYGVSAEEGGGGLGGVDVDDLGEYGDHDEL